MEDRDSRRCRRPRANLEKKPFNNTAGRCVANKYLVGPKIGSVGFGEVYMGTDRMTNEEVAIKVEWLREEGGPPRHLLHEAFLYKTLQGGRGIPTVRSFSREDDRWVALVLDLLGPSLADLFDYCERTFSLKTVLMLADEMLGRIEYVHSKGILQRDIKPENFVMGRGTQSHEVYMIDFGLAAEYRDPNTREPVSSYGGHLDTRVLGTIRYASLNTHHGVPQSPRDDLESLGYVLVYFLRGSLPWQGLTFGMSPKRKMETVRSVKKHTEIKILCHGYPPEFESYFRYCRSLRFDEEPDYAHLKHKFRDLFVREGFKFDYVYDWNIKHKLSLGRSVHVEEAAKLSAYNTPHGPSPCNIPQG